MLTWSGPSITNEAGYKPDLLVLEVPITLRRNWLLGDHSRIFIFAGPNFSFPLSAEGNIASGTALTKDDLKPFDFLIDAGLGQPSGSFLTGICKGACATPTVSRKSLKNPSVAWTNGKAGT